MKRSNISKKTKDAVLAAFNHRCALCGGDRPQLHHIDGNNKNNDEMNLIPLCPNHHLVDQHDPTRSHDPDRLRFFREHRDPRILAHQFKPLFDRIRFLLQPITDVSDPLMREKVDDLISFVRHLKMGAYYAEKLRSCLVFIPPTVSISVDWENLKEGSEITITPICPSTYPEFVKRVLRYVVEQLRFQDWQSLYPVRERSND